MNSMLLVWFGEQLSVPNYSPNQVKKTKSFEDRNLSYFKSTITYHLKNMNLRVDCLIGEEKSFF